MPSTGQAPQVKVVLLAGGGGERFWPRSRPHWPKQFLDLDGSGSLLQQAYRRALALVEPAAVFVATRASYTGLVRDQLPDLAPDRLIPEPVGRDTAPGLGLAALLLARRDPDAVMVALPADHYIPDTAAFARVAAAAAAAAARHQALVTMGIRPSRPETGYGYVQVGTPAGESFGRPVYRVQRFVEKPDAATAAGYLAGGGYLWNSGMFAWPVRVLLAEIGRHLPDLAAVLAELDRHRTLSSLRTALPRVFPQAPKVSIDYGVLEKSNNVLVVPADFTWDDVGTWTALERMRPGDDQGNRVRGTAVLHGSRNTVVEGNGRVIAAVGVENLIIVDTDDAVLVCHRDHAQAVRQVTTRAEAALVKAAPGHPPAPAAGQVVDKPWGREVWWAVTDHYVGKLIEVRAGHSLSRQYHVEKHETLYFQRGRGRLLVGAAWQPVGPGTVVTLPPGTTHQLEAITDLAVIEVSTPHLDDVVRLSDRYGRAAPGATHQPDGGGREPV